jgi:hypothetical protein
MTKRLFLHILEKIKIYDEYFEHKINAAGVVGCSPLQKMTAALRMLAYGGPADGLDEYLRMGESTIIESLKRFTESVVAVFGPSYLRAPNNLEVAQLLAKAEERGFPGMLGSIDCMHWRWEKCPHSLARDVHSHYQKPTLILEVVASHDLRIWHACFGLPGSHNDVNVLHRSPVFDDLASGNAVEVNFTINGNQYNMGYYLADGIYPDWATLVKSVSLPQGRKKRFFAKKQAEFRKDVERAFGVLQSRWSIMHGPARFWTPRDLNYIVYCIIILHNMIIEDEREMTRLANEDYIGSSNPSYGQNRNVPAIEELIKKHEAIQSVETNNQLQLDLIEHIWSKFGDEDIDD